MKQFLITLLAFSCVTVAQGQYYSDDKEKIAVYVSGEDALINKTVGNRLVLTIVRQGKYTAVERSAEILAQLQKEYGYQRGGNVDARQISQVGKQFGVDIVCMAEIMEVDFLNTYDITVRLINVETAEITKMTQAYSKLKTIDNLTITTSKLAAELLDIPFVRKQKGFYLAGEALYLNGLGWGGTADMGYRFNSYVALSAGSGYALYAGENFKGYAIPVFANLRVNILPYVVSPYIAAAGGACLDRYTNTDAYTVLGKTMTINNEYETIYIYYNVSAGLYLRCTDVFALHAGAGYNNVANAFTVNVGFAVTFVN